MRLFCAILLMLGLALPGYAQDPDSGWTFSGNFSGSANSSGVVTKLEPVLNYSFNKYVSVYGGIPFYFVNGSPTNTQTRLNASLNPAGASGLGNVFFGADAGTDNDALNFGSTLEFTAPTGSESRGFSTGQMTVDWTNQVSYTFSSLTPFGSAGIANTVSDTTFFVRPFSSHGTIAHFEGGLIYDVTDAVSITASGYAIRGSGEQRVISRVFTRSGASTGVQAARLRGALGNIRRVFEDQLETRSAADLIEDQGFSASVEVAPTPRLDFHGGYSRSTGYSYNTVFFGIGFHISR